MADFSSLNGYNVKDAQARQDIATLQTTVNTDHEPRITSLESGSGDTSRLITKHVDTIEDLRDLDPAVEGDVVVTKGYYEANDGGSGVYLIREKEEEEIDNGATIIEVGATLVAELLIDSTIKLKQLGAKGDSINDDSSILEFGINLASSNKIPIELNGTFLIDSELVIDNANTTIIKGNLNNINTLVNDFTNIPKNLIFGENGKIRIQGVSNVKFENIGFKGVNKCLSIESFKNTIDNCFFTGFINAIEFNTGRNWVGENRIKDCSFHSLTNSIVLNAGSDSDITGCLVNSTVTTFITGGFDAGFKIENNHDYSQNGSIINGINVTFVGNYVDGFNKLVISGNSACNITGNTFLGTVSDNETNYYAIKYTNTNVASGNISGNMMTCGNNAQDYSNVYFLNIDEVSYFITNISGNDIRIAKNMFYTTGTLNTQIFYCKFNQPIKGNFTIETAAPSNVTITSQSVNISNGLVICHATANLTNVPQWANDRVLTMPNIGTNYTHFIKPNNVDEYIKRGDNKVSAGSNYANATSIEVTSIGFLN